MAATDPAAGQWPDPEARFRRELERVLVGLIAATALARVVLVSRLNINWDEFYYLSFVHDFRNGRLALALQTFHVHFFGWVLQAGTNEVDQVIAARIAYFVMTLGSCALIYRIARHYVSRPAALFSALCYLCYSNILEHGMAFRADGLASFLTLAAIALAIRESPGPTSCFAAGGIAAIALLVTIKTVFVVPTIVLLVVISAWPLGRRRVGANLLAFLAGLVGVFMVCFVVHAAGVREASLAQATAFSRRVGKFTLGSADLLPGWPYVVTTIGQNGFVWIYVVSGLILARSARFRQRRGALASLALLSLASPLVSVLFYRNAFPYFFVFLMPPVLVLCGLPFEAVVARGAEDRSNQRIAVYMIAGITWAFSLRLGIRLPDEVSHQRRILTAVHEVFPEPVPYIDRNGFVSSFPKVGFFMSTWGMQEYLLRASPMFEELLRRHAPALLVVNSPALVLNPIDTVYAGTPAYRLLPVDSATLSTNYVHHWGPLYVAGRRFELGQARTAVPVLIPGTYTVEASGPVEIDGVPYSPGRYVHLPSGEHLFVSRGGAQEVTLRWGRSLPVPTVSPPRRRIYVDF